MMGAFGGSSAGATKTEDVVDFPIEGLDMSKYYLGNEAKEQSMIYDCYAVSNHFGSMGFGHYTAFAKNSSTWKWFEFDDARVTEVPSEHVKRKWSRAPPTTSFSEKEIGTRRTSPKVLILIKWPLNQQI